MSNPNGNPGNRGGGRKSAYQEMVDANMLWEVFNKEYTREELEKVLKSGKHSIKDTWIAKAYAGNERFIQQIIHKLFADKKQIEMGGFEGEPIEISDPIMTAINKAYGKSPEDVPGSR